MEPLRNRSDDKSAKPIDERRAYRKPSLRIYGRVSVLTRGTNSAGNDGAGDHTRNSMSDRRTKTNVVRVGQHPLGIGLYVFDYKPAFQDRWGKGRRFGVMADEVATVLPEAVRVDGSGYQMVDYGRLRIELAV